MQAMHERRYTAEIDRLRSPQRVALLEVDRIVDLASEGLAGKTVLDIGTGSGVFAEAFAKRGFSVTGIDPNPAMLNAAQEYVPNGIFLKGIAEEIPLKDKTFDMVFLGHVLHESDDIVKTLKETKRCARNRVVIMEWPYKQDESGPPLEHRLTIEEVHVAATTVGFSSLETIQLHHMVLFRATI
jgi:ubiquinone/menaquinone biosynthesis C-methylase UbiE